MADALALPAGELCGTAAARGGSRSDALHHLRYSLAPRRRSAMPWMCSGRPMMAPMVLCELREL